MIDIVNGLLIRGGMALLVRRGPRRRAYGNTWSFPGGHVEAAETMETALVRELEEELGIVATDYAPLTTLADPNAELGAPVTYHMFTVTAWRGGEPALRGHEHTELRWFHLRDAMALGDLALHEYRPLLRGLGPPMVRPTT